MGLSGKLDMQAVCALMDRMGRSSMTTMAYDNPYEAAFAHIAVAASIVLAKRNPAMPTGQVGPFARQSAGALLSLLVEKVEDTRSADEAGKDSVPDGN